MYKNNCIVGPLRCFASEILIAHTHPSGELSLSKPDMDLPIRLTYARKLMDIELVDHLYITKDSYLSMSGDDLI